jgi:hypothetical protein
MVLFPATVVVPVASCAIGFCSYRRIRDLYVAAGWLLVVGGEGLVGYWLLQSGGDRLVSYLIVVVTGYCSDGVGLI